MDNARYLDCLAADYARLRTLAHLDLAAPVPSCPGWTVADLTTHVGLVYLHKVGAMREGAEPPWPWDERPGEEPVATLDRGYTGLLEELARRTPEEPGGTWYPPDPSVGFWYRRMAQETVIHRIDAELGTQQPIAPVPADLAIDGIDELLKVFVAFGVAEWGDYFAAILADSPDRTYTLRTDGAAWRVATGPGRFDVEDGAGDDDADVTISGSPTAVLRWVWNRELAGEPSEVTVEGPADAVAALKGCITTATS
jgi:uncharacterized protein (TIGR03083 family)